MGTDALLSVERAAKRLHVAPRHLRDAVKSGELEAIKPGRRTLFVTEAALATWLRSKRVETPSQRARAIAKENARRA